VHFVGLFFVFIVFAVENIQISFKSDKNNRYFTRRPTSVTDHIPLSSS